MNAIKQYFLKRFCNAQKQKIHFLIFVCLTFNGIAQQPIFNCLSLLNDLPQVANKDSILEVNLKFWCLAHNTNSASGLWTKPGHVTTYTDAVAITAAINSMLANMPTMPQLTLPN